MPKHINYTVLDKDIYKGKSKPISFATNKAAKQFKTVLTREYKKQADFAGHYIVASIGCGTMCQQNWIINTKTGNIIGPVSSELGIEHKIDSNLLITNPVEPLSSAEIQSYKNWLKTEYYLLDNDQLSKLYSVETIQLRPSR